MPVLLVIYFASMSKWSIGCFNLQRVHTDASYSCCSLSPLYWLSGWLPFNGLFQVLGSYLAACLACFSFLLTFSLLFRQHCCLFTIRTQSQTHTYPSFHHSRLFKVYSISGSPDRPLIKRINKKKLIKQFHRAKNTFLWEWSWINKFIIYNLFPCVHPNLILRSIILNFVCLTEQH